MNTPTSNAPHICWNVLRNTSPSSLPLSLPMANSQIATMIHDARIEVPPMYGAKLNTAVAVGLAGSQAATSDGQPAAVALNQLTFGSGDHGPVQAATTTSRITNGIHACTTSPALRPWPRFCCAADASTATPP